MSVLYKRLTQTQMIAIGYVLVILTGTLLFNASGIIEIRGSDGICRFTFHRHIRILCHRTGDCRYLPPLVTLWPVGHPKG